MIEDVKRLCAELHLHTFCYPRIFQQGHVKVVDAGSTKEPALGVSDLPNRFCHEVIWVEI
jgi:hypothetical protein